MKISILCLFLLATSAYATGDQDHTCQGGHNCGGEGNGQAEAQSEAIASAESVSGASSISTAEGGAGGYGGEGGSASSAGGAASASSEGSSVNISETTNIENNSSNIVLVPNNNTENCLRVFGIAWGKNGESGALGIPWRSKKCDFEQAADDAFAQGEREIGWFWKCENPNLYKSFKDKGESAGQASVDCLNRMLGGMRATTTITTLTEMLETSEEERRISRKLHQESVERLTDACNESKDRILNACMSTK